jgi:hypothetical protein
MALAHGSSLAPAGLLKSALDGRDGPAAVRAIVTSPLEHGVAELLDAALPAARPRSLQLLRSKYKPTRKLTGYYTVADGEALVRRHVAVTWTADGGVGLLVSPTDPAMPEIGRLADPPALGRLVEELSGPGRPAGSPRVTTVRYRPGQRHVLEARYPAGPAVYVKVDRDTSGARAVPVAHALRDVFLGEMPEAGIVQPVGFSPPDRAALWWEVPGRVLAALVRSGSGAASAVEQVGRAVRVIHESASTPGEHPALDAVGTRAVESEVAGTVRAGEHIAALLPEVGAIYADVVADVVTRLDRLPVDGPTFTHGDLKAENLLVDSGRLHVLDLDRACWTEPAMDLGKFVADLRWWSRSPHAAAGLETAFRAGYGEGDPIRWARAGLLATLFEVKFAARRCVVHDPHWSSRVRAQVARAAPPAVATRSR